MGAAYRFFIGGIIPTANAMIVLSTSNEHRGKVYGIAAGVRSLGGAMGPISGGIIASALSLRAVFTFAT